MFTWPTLGEGLQVKGTIGAKAERYEQAGICGRCGTQRREISHGGFLTPQYDWTLLAYVKGP